MHDGQTIVNCARGWLSTPFRHQARLRGVGADCWGLVLGVGLELNMPWAKKAARDPVCNNYARRPHGDALRQITNRYFDPIPISSAGIGDVLIAAFKSEPTHFVIVSSMAPLQIIHSFAQARKVTEHGVDEAWRKLIVGAYRYRC